jgi:hypothetical protein
MRGLDSRLDKLEHGLGLASDLPRFNAIVDRLDRTLALTTDRCVEILDEEGCLLPSGFNSINLGYIPDGLNAAETKQYLREHGSELCGGRVSTGVRINGTCRPYVPEVQPR